MEWVCHQKYTAAHQQKQLTVRHLLLRLCTPAEISQVSIFHFIDWIYSLETCFSWLQLIRVTLKKWQDTSVKLIPKLLGDYRFLFHAFEARRTLVSCETMICYEQIQIIWHCQGSGQKKKTKHNWVRYFGELLHFHNKWLIPKQKNKQPHFWHKFLGLDVKSELLQ